MRKLYFLVKKKIIKRKAYDRKRKSIDLPSIEVKCEECPKTLASDNHLKIHMKSYHTESEKPTNKKQKVVPIANYASELEENKDETMKCCLEMDNASQDYTCSVCCKKFTMVTDVWLHVAREHEKRYVSQDLQKSFKLFKDTVASEAEKEEEIVNVILSQLSMIRNDLSLNKNEHKNEADPSRKKNEETKKKKYDEKKREHTRKDESRRKENDDKKENVDSTRKEEEKRNKPDKVEKRGEENKEDENTN